MTINYVRKVTEGVRRRTHLGGKIDGLKDLKRLSNQLQNDFYENSRWRESDTYDHTREIPANGKYKDKHQRNDSGRTFQMGERYRYNRRGVNCAVFGEGDGNVESHVRHRGSSGYQWGHRLIQVNVA